MNPKHPIVPNLVQLTLRYIDGHRLVEQHLLVPDDHPTFELDSPRFHTVLSYPAHEPDPTVPAPRFDGDDRPIEATLLVAPTCELCLADEGAAFAVGLGFDDVLGATRIIPVCGRHTAVRPELDLETLTSWVGVRVLWGELTDPFVIDVLAQSDHHRGIVRPSLRDGRRYAHELTRGETASVFAEHLRVDGEGEVWLPTWARVIAGLPGTDVPITRRDDGELEIDLTDLAIARPVRRLTDETVSDFVIPVNRVGEPRTPAGHDDWVAASTDHHVAS